MGPALPPSGAAQRLGSMRRFVVQTEGLCSGSEIFSSEVVGGASETVDERSEAVGGPSGAAGGAAAVMRKPSASASRPSYGLLFPYAHQLAVLVVVRTV